MKRRGKYRNSVIVVLLFAAATRVWAADSPAKSVPTRPYFSFFVASVDRFVAACNFVFESVDRPDLAASFSERRKSYRDFAGIRRDKPLGLMRVWNETSSADIVFLPVEDINELLTTATFGVVGFHAVSPNRYEIERIDSPYPVLVRDNFAFFADSLISIQALQVTPDQLTRTLRDRYDMVLLFDPKQIPQQIKVRYVDEMRSGVEPWLQKQDDEPVETANLRKALGKIALDLIQRIVIDTSEVTIGGRLDLKTHHLILEIVVEAGKGSALANGLNRLVSRRSEFGPMVSSDVPAGVALNLPLGNLVEQVVGKSREVSAKPEPLEVGLQLVGHELGKLSLIGAIRGDQIVELNNALPRWIIKLDKSGKFAAVRESFDVHETIVFHSLVPHELPRAIAQLVGPDVEIIVGQGAEVLWLGIGSPESVLEQMKSAIDSIEKSSEARSIAPLVKARFQAKQLPELIAPDKLSSNLDIEEARNAFAKGQDGFSLVLEPVANGIKLRIEAEEGFIRLIGTNWVKQVDNSNR